MYCWRTFVGYLGICMYLMSWNIHEMYDMVILVHLDESQFDLQLMHDWYILGTLLEALASTIVGTWFMDDVAYMYGYTFRRTS